MRQAKLWSYSAGHRGVNRVRVYERRDGASLYIEWFDDDGRHQKALRNVAGHPVTDRDLAKRIADSLSREQERRRNELASGSFFGFRPTATLGEVLRRLHEARAKKWAPGYKRDQDGHRVFWLDKLGGETPLVRIKPDTVERIAAAAANDFGWSPRTHGKYLKYLVSAFRYAHRKLQVIREDQTLSAVDIPSPRSKSRPYSKDETRRLIRALGDIDPRAEWIGRMAYTTGRRLSALRLVRVADILEVAGAWVVRFPEDTDKAGNAGLAAITGRTLTLTRDLLARAEGPYLLGAPTLDECMAWIRRAEDVAGIPHVRYRAWHGLKRRFSTDAPNRRAASKQSGTREDTLRDHYEQDGMDELPEKAALARALEQELGGPTTVPRV